MLKAYNGLDALEMLTENDVQLMLLDIMMPKLDGIKTLLKLRETKNIPVILISAKSGTPIRFSALRLAPTIPHYQAL